MSSFLALAGYLAIIAGIFGAYFGGYVLACRRSPRFRAFIVDLFGPERDR